MLDTESSSTLQETYFDWLSEVAHQLAEIRDIAEIDRAYQIVTHKATLLANGEASIYRFDATTDGLTLVYSAQCNDYPDAERNPVGQDVHAKVAQERRSLVIERGATAENNRPASSAAAHKNLTVVTPLQIGNDYFGNFCMAYGDAHTPGDIDVKFCEAIVLQLATALQRLEAAAALRLAEQRALAAEALSTTSASMFELAHRLGNDLGLIRSYVDDIQYSLDANGVAIPSVDRALNYIQRDVSRVLALSASLRDTFRELRQPNEVAAVSPDLSAEVVIRETIQSFPNLPDNIQVTLEVAENIALFRANHRQTTDILRNLVTNAIEAMPTGGALTVRAFNSGGFVVFQVADTGKGIRPTDLPRIFSLFYSTKDSFGFGLWSARRLALANGGDLTCSSDVVKGTVFTLTLPRTGQL